MKDTVAHKLVAFTNRRLIVFHLNNAKALHIHSDFSEILEMYLIIKVRTLISNCYNLLPLENYFTDK